MCANSRSCYKATAITTSSSGMNINWPACRRRRLRRSPPPARVVISPNHLLQSLTRKPPLLEHLLHRLEVRNASERTGPMQRSLQVPQLRNWIPDPQQSEGRRAMSHRKASCRAYGNGPPPKSRHLSRRLSAVGRRQRGKPGIAALLLQWLNPKSSIIFACLRSMLTIHTISFFGSENHRISTLIPFSPLLLTVVLIISGDRYSYAGHFTFADDTSGQENLQFTIYYTTDSMYTRTRGYYKIRLFLSNRARYK